jgi:hypothetical protein
VKLISIALHFQLYIPQDSDNFDETKFAYVPQLDAKRDGELLDILDECLVDEIEFERSHATKFYMKVVESMSKKVMFVEDVSEG